MTNILSLPQMSGSGTTFAFTTNSDWRDSLYFSAPGFGPNVSGVGTITSGSNVVTLSLLAGATPVTLSAVQPGMIVLGIGVPAGAFVGTIGATSITFVDLNGNPLNATINDAAADLVFQAPPLDLTGINFLANLRMMAGAPQVFLTAQTADGSMINGKTAGTLAFAVPNQPAYINGPSTQQVPPNNYVMDIIAMDGTYTINLFPQGPATVMVGAGIADPSLLL